jgi:hypothetical protein
MVTGLNIEQRSFVAALLRMTANGGRCARKGCGGAGPFEVSFMDEE